jgi:hypothetical protein
MSFALAALLAALPGPARSRHGITVPGAFGRSRWGTCRPERKRVIQARRRRERTAVRDARALARRRR